jgi:hypothetical protein
MAHRRAAFGSPAVSPFVGIALLAAAALTGCCGAAREPPGGDYRKVSELVRFPDFYPGLGTLYVQPETLPVGPFRAYDRDGRLVSTIYMVPLQTIDAHAMLNMVQGAPLRVDHVDMHYTSGHPGVDQPHYHIILWHVSSEQATKLME